MDKRRLGALGLINAALLAAAALLWQGGVEPKPAEAQGFGGGANYIMVSGLVNGLDQQAVYVIETTSGRMVGFYFNSNNKQVELLGGRSITQDLQELRENSR
ncbi:MAG: hypothetical protein AAF288_03085 [Planctomycetota bacterium]